MNKVTITAKELTPGDRVNLFKDHPERYIMVGRVAVDFCCGLVQVVSISGGVLHNAGTLGQDVEVEVLR